MIEKRTEIIKEILELFGDDNPELMVRINSSEDISDFLRKEAVIYPCEYEAMLECRVDTIGGVLDNLSKMASLLRRKQRISNLYAEYCQYFLGELVSYGDLEIKDNGTFRQYGYLDLRDEMGYIDYTIYLNQLSSESLDSDLDKNELKKVSR